MQKGPDSRGGWPLNVTVVPFPLFGGVGRSIQLGPCGDTVIQQEEVQPFLALLVVDGEMSMPQESMPIIFRGGRLVMATRVLPTNSSGL